MANRIRTFSLQRDTDETGVSGSGPVADGVVFPDGTVALRWRANLHVGHQSTAVYDSVEAVEAIHGHGGLTRVVFTATVNVDARLGGSV